MEAPCICPSLLYQGGTQGFTGKKITAVSQVRDPAGAGAVVVKTSWKKRIDIAVEQEKSRLLHALLLGAVGAGTL